MKRSLVVLWMFALVCGLVSATGSGEEVKAEEPAKPIELYIATPDGLDHLQYQLTLEGFYKEFPDVKLIDVPIDTKEATTVTMDQRIAAMLPVHFYNDYFSRSGKYVIPKSAGGKIWALDLAKYWDDEDQFVSGVLDPYWIDGELLATPSPIMLVGMHINTTILKKAGYVLPPPDEWTLEEFYKMCEKVKTAGISDTWPTAMFAASRSGDWHYMSFFSTFGFKSLFNSDYSAAIVNNEMGINVFRFWKDLLDKGYIPPEAAVMADGTGYIPMRDTGLLAVAGARVGYYDDPELMQKKIEAGKITEPYSVVMYPFPKAPGVETVPMISTYNLGVAFGSDDEEINKIVGRFAWYMNNNNAQELYICGRPELGLTGTTQFPTRSNVEITFENEAQMGWWYDSRVLLEKHGALDVGGSLPCYGEIRGALFPVNQLLFSRKITPEEAATMYEANLNAVLDEYKNK